jgi:hypothetical protein
LPNKIKVTEKGLLSDFIKLGRILIPKSVETVFEYFFYKWVDLQNNHQDIFTESVSCLKIDDIKK